MENCTGIAGLFVSAYETMSSFWFLTVIFSWLIVSLYSLILESFEFFAIDSRSFPNALILPQKASLEEWKTYRFTRISDGFGSCQKVPSPVVLPVLSGGRYAFGCSISSPDMSQSNCCQEMGFASSESLGLHPLIKEQETVAFP